MAAGRPVYVLRALSCRACVCWVGWVGGRVPSGWVGCVADRVLLAALPQALIHTQACTAACTAASPVRGHVCCTFAWAADTLLPGPGRGWQCWWGVMAAGVQTGMLGPGAAAASRCIASAQLSAVWVCLTQDLRLGVAEGPNGVQCSNQLQG